MATYDLTKKTNASTGSQNVPSKEEITYGYNIFNPIK